MKTRTKTGKKREATMKTASRVLAAALLAASGCERRAASHPGRETEAYRKAIEAYTAGRIDEAARRFQAAVKADPSNSDARFQLAVLQQDVKHDFISALAGYGDYLLLAPDGEKTSIARERMTQCERLFAAEVAKKANLADVSGMKEELAAAKAKLAEKEKAAADAEKSLEEAKSRLATLERETAQLRSVIAKLREGPDETDSAPPPGRTAPFAKDDGSVDDDEAKAPRRPAETAASEDAKASPVTLNPEAKALFEEEEREAAKEKPKQAHPEKTEKEQDGSGKSGTVDPGKGKQDRAEKSFLQLLASPDGKDGADKAPATRRHTVEEGETLGEIAKKYYGRKSHWRKIQEANKTIVPQDGRVKAGQELVIP